MSDKPEKIDNILQSNKIRLQAPCPTEPKKMSTLGWDIWGNNPRVILDTKDPKLANPDMQYGRIQGAMAPADFYAFLENVKVAIASPVEWKRKTVILGKAPGGQQFDPPVAQCDLWVGKDKEGCVYLSLISRKQGFPTIKFVFNAPDFRYIEYKEQTGEDLSKAEQSVLYAKAYVEMLTVMMAAVLTKEYIKPPPFIPGNKGGGGGNYGNKSYGGGNRGGGNYNNNQSSDSSGADIPF